MLLRCDANYEKQALLVNKYRKTMVSDLKKF